MLRTTALRLPWRSVNAAIPYTVPIPIPTCTCYSSTPVISSLHVASFATLPHSKSADPIISKSGKQIILDDAIQVSHVRVILPDSRQLQGPMTLREAKKLATQHGLNLLQVSFPSPTATGDAAIAICRLVDHNKMMYEENKKEREKRKAVQNSPDLQMKKNAAETKTVQFRDKIDPHDLSIKCNMINEWLKDGYHVKIQCKSWNGGESAMRPVMDRIITSVTDGEILEAPKMQGDKMMSATFQKKKIGAAKKSITTTTTTSSSSSTAKPATTTATATTTPTTAKPTTTTTTTSTPAEPVKPTTITSPSPTPTKPIPSIPTPKLKSIPTIQETISRDAYHITSSQSRKMMNARGYHTWNRPMHVRSFSTAATTTTTTTTPTVVTTAPPTLATPSASEIIPTTHLKLYLTFSSNNIHVYLCNQSNQSLVKLSSGSLKFKGTTKKCAVAAESLAIVMAGKIRAMKFDGEYPSLYIYIKGISTFKTGFMKKLLGVPLPVNHIFLNQIIQTAHNGCKLPKKRRK